MDRQHTHDTTMNTTTTTVTTTRHDHDHDHRHEHFFAHAGRPARPRWRGGGRGGWAGGRRMRRGAIRTAILLALREEPAHGYEVMRRLEEMSGGLWRPSPGSVYPHLQMLEDEGLVQSSEVDGSRTLHPDRCRPGRGREDRDCPCRAASPTTRSATSRVHRTAHERSQAALRSRRAAQIERGIAIIQKARKELYQILAED